MNLNLGKAAGGALAGGAGKAAKGGCGSIIGVFIGLLLVPLGFYLVYYGEVKLVNHGKVFDSLEMVSAEQAKGMNDELVKTSGTLEGSFLTVEHFDGPALYDSVSIEEYEESKDSDGNIDYDWESKSTDSEWTNFTIGGIAVKPKGANAVGEETVWEGYKSRGLSNFEERSGSSGSAQVGDQRMTVEVLDARKPVIVVGQMAGDGVSGGSTFVVSTLAETATSQALHTEYKISYWMIKGGAVLGIGIGICMIFGPLLAIVGYIPLIGDRISAGFVFAAFFFALVVVGVTTVLIKMFWVLLILAVVGIALLIWKAFSSPRTKPGTVAPQAAAPVAAAVATPQPVAQPTPSQSEVAPSYDADGNLICPKCHAGITADDHFCTNCGAKLDAGRII